MASFLFALSLLASACGSGSGSTTGLGASVGGQETSAQSEGSTSDGGTSGGSAIDGNATDESATDEESAIGPVVAPEHLFPSLDVVEVHTGETLNLADELAGGDRPVLLWFWAPHWPACRAEGPTVEQFARDHGDELRIIGMGAQDSFELAENFVASTGTESLTMIWDESFQSWSYYGVQGQPAALLVDAAGTPIEGWLGAFNLDEALELARNA